MRTITTNTDVFTFDELDKAAQEKALDHIRGSEGYIDYPWYEPTFDMFIEEKLTPQGWDTERDDVHFSGFWSQGDGACFDGKLDIKTYLEYNKLTEKYPLTYKMTVDGPYVWGEIHKNSYGTFYSHERTRYFELEAESESALELDGGLSPDEVKKLHFELEDLEKDIEEDRYSLACELYRTLEKEYDYLLSDECIKEHFAANEYEFTSDGTPFYA